MQTASSVHKVLLTPVGTDGWELSYNNGHSRDPSHYPQVDVDMGAGPQLISFEIQGSDPAIQFDSTPIGVERGLHHKPSKGKTDAQLSAFVVANGGKQLVVLDKNDNNGPLSLSYQLFFSGHGPLDPIINNGGRPPMPAGPPPPPGHPGATAVPSAGSTSQIAGYDLSAIVIGLIIGLIIGFILCWLRRGSPDRTSA
jgi:hypothetical protein